MLTKYQALFLLWICVVGAVCWIIAFHIFSDWLDFLDRDDVITGFSVVMFCIISCGYFLWLKIRGAE